MIGKLKDLAGVLLPGTGAAKTVTTAVGALGNVIDQFTESPEEKRLAEQIMLRIQQRPYLAQVELNKIEAQSRSWFNSGWRPFIGWVLGVSLALYFIPKFALAAFLWVKLCLAKNALLPYPVSLDQLIELLGGMLGLALIRTREKNTGKAA